ncbi:protein FAM171B isoform X1 [Erpetoichthys calabaricus]|uniref:Family with sequence similarity 171 member B n=1 Tax=Erpetoichthys calabaricus TaxID=27687 RepID=A0A8C4TQD3_ERPCA|nr:protein FAM171B isoform X1 [Erpetoichthys calabaricus]
MTPHPRAADWQTGGPHLLDASLCFAMSHLPAFSPLLVLLLVVEYGKAGSGRAEPGSQGIVVVEQQQQQQPGGRMASASGPGSAFTLRVQVNDLMSRQHLRQAAVEVFVNHSKTNSGFTDDDGSIVLKVPYSLGLPLTIVAHTDGFMLKPLPWKTSKMPIFSSVTLSLHPQSQGNIWLFEDSVLITGKLSDGRSQPSVQFAKGLLKLPDRANMSSVTAYLTQAQLPIERDCFPYTMGVLSHKSGYKSFELKPIAALSVHLLSGGKKVKVAGPVQILLPLPETTRLGPADTIPAWTFDMKTGGWLNRGLGTIRQEEEGLVWSYVAPHLGYWMAAPLPGTSGSFGRSSMADFALYHTHLLMAILAGTVLIVIGFFALLFCYCQGSVCAPRGRKLKASKADTLKKDQTTSTNGKMEEKRPSQEHRAEDGRRCPSQATARAQQADEHKEVHLTLSEAVYGLAHLYNQPVAILPAPELFGASEQLAGCKSATLPRKAQVVYNKGMQSSSKDNYTQTLPKMPGLPHLPSGEAQQVLEGPQGSACNPGSWGRYSSLLESVSVPGTLNEAVAMGPFCSELQGISEQTLMELSKGKPSPHPRAWFVSLEGKPVAQVRHSFIDLQKKRKPGDSNDTSLDSGLDMNEHHPGRKLEREKMFLQSVPQSKEDLHLSSSESGTSSGSQGTRRLRLSKDKGKPQGDKGSWQGREEKPLVNMN